MSETNQPSTQRSSRFRRKVPDDAPADRPPDRGAQIRCYMLVDAGRATRLLERRLAAQAPPAGEAGSRLPS